MNASANNPGEEGHKVLEFFLLLGSVRGPFTSRKQEILRNTKILYD